MMAEIICRRCGKSTLRNSPTQKFCPECARQRHREDSMRWKSKHRHTIVETRRCPICGQEFVVQPTARTKEYCSEKCRNRGAYYRRLLREGKTLPNEQTRESEPMQPQVDPCSRICPDCRKSMPMDYPYYRCPGCRAKWLAKYHVSFSTSIDEMFLYD